jgi:phosphotransferase system  glucose/maltose/N-acetylglucosamine-specific IIC component
MADSENGGTSEQTSALERAGQVFAVFILVLLAAGIVFAVVGIYPHKIPTTKNPSFVDDIFASRVVILAVRITLLFASAYIAVSVVGLIASRRWIAELGPFKASEPIARLDESAAAMEADLGDALKTIEDLERRLLESDETLAEADGHIGALLDVVDKMEDAKEADQECHPRTARD